MANRKRVRKRVKRTKENIMALLKEAETGDISNVDEFCRKHGIGQSTFYKWRNQYGVTKSSAGSVRRNNSSAEKSYAQRIKALENENRRLKQMYAELSLEIRMQEESEKQL